MCTFSTVHFHVYVRAGVCVGWREKREQAEGAKGTVTGQHEAATVSRQLKYSICCEV